MQRKTFLTLVASVAILIGLFALILPDILLREVKHSIANPAALVMARTVGVLLFAIGVLLFSVRDHRDSPTLKAVLFANLILQLTLIPIDLSAYLQGTFKTLGSFLPPTLLHFALATGFGFYFMQLAKNPTLKTPSGAP